MIIFIRHVQPLLDCATSKLYPLFEMRISLYNHDCSVLTGLLKLAKSSFLARKRSGSGWISRPSLGHSDWFEFSVWNGLRLQYKLAVKN